MRGLGGIEATRAALTRFRQAPRAAGFADLHLNAVVWGVQISPNEEKISEPNQLLAALGFDSVSSYVWIHDFVPPVFPASEYSQLAAQMPAQWRTQRDNFALPYHPNVTMG